MYKYIRENWGYETPAAKGLLSVRLLDCILTNLLAQMACQVFAEKINLRNPSYRSCGVCEICEPASHDVSHFCKFFRLVHGLGGRRSFHGRLSLYYLYKPPLHHLESGDGPGNECKRYNLALRVLSLSLGINFSIYLQKCLKLKYS